MSDEKPSKHHSDSTKKSSTHPSDPKQKPSSPPPGCQLKEEDPKDSKFKGTTLFTDGKHCIQFTAVYLSEKFDKKSPWNVILWFHGWHVKDPKKNIFGKDTDNGETQLRESVDKAGKENVVLLVPWLGHKELKEGSLGLGNLKTKGLKTYLDEVLGLIGTFLGMDPKDPSDEVDDLIGTFLEMVPPIGTFVEMVPKIDSTKIDKLVLACHSGSQRLMRDAALGLGSLKDKLKEFWGFDCMYPPGKEFADWAKGKDLLGKLIYFYAGAGTIDNSQGYKQVPSYFVEAYGKKPPMANVFLAVAVKHPDLKGVSDDEVKESLEDIQKKTKSGGGTPYEKLRLELDKKLNDPGEWNTAATNHHLRGHYEVVQLFLEPRISDLFNERKNKP